jgi:hypothetical protein
VHCIGHVLRDLFPRLLRRIEIAMAIDECRAEIGLCGAVLDRKI